MSESLADTQDEHDKQHPGRRCPRCPVVLESRAQLERRLARSRMTLWQQIASWWRQ